MLNQQQIIKQRYQLQQKLGDCSIRQTWLAKELATNSLVIIKLLAFGARTQWQDLRLFEREAQILQQLNHPFIPKYHDYFTLESSSTWYVLVEQYIPGRSLQSILNQGKTFSEAEVKVIAKKLLNILEYLHQLNPQVLHRDIKPSNIILGEDEEIYLVDFGSIQNQMSAEGKSFTIVGTYGYTPLEQFGGRTVPASDLYALGVTLIHLLTGIPPAELPQSNLQIQFPVCLKISKYFAKWLTKITHPAVEYRFSNVIRARRAIDFSLPELPVVACIESKKRRLIVYLIAFAVATFSTQVISKKIDMELELGKIKYCQRVKMREEGLELDRLVDLTAIPNRCRDQSHVVERLNKEKKSLAWFDLSRIHLNQADLNKANLYGASLHKTYLIEADLQNAYLSYADLDYANLENANLENASFGKNEIEGTNFSRANLRNADFRVSVMSNVNFYQAILPMARLKGKISDSNFEMANLGYAHLYGEFINNNFQSAILSNATIHGDLDSNFNRASFKSAVLSFTRFSGSFQEAIFSFATLQNSDFIDADLEKAYFYAADLKNAEFKSDSAKTNIKEVSFLSTDLQKAVFNSVDFYGVNLRHANLKGTTIINSNPTAYQIKTACNWEQAYFINVEPNRIIDNLELYKIANQQQNQQYIEQLKQDKASDPKKPVDCSKWE